MRYEKIETEQQAKELLGKLQRYTGPLGFDCETTGIDPTKESPSGRGRIYCWSLAALSDRSVHIEGVGPILESDSYYVTGKLLPMFAELLRTAPLVGHNIHGFDRHLLANHGIEATNIVGDTQRMFRLYEPSRTSSAGLKQLARYWLGFKQPSFNSITKRPEHLEDLICHKLRKNEVGPVIYRETKRKVGEQRGVPTLLVAGPVWKFYKKLEYIPLAELEEIYPARWETFMKYAALDAGLTLEMYQCLQTLLSNTKWRMPA